MSEATALRERAAKCREIARDYRDDVGAPLHEMARDFEARASEIERNAFDRRVRYASAG